MITALRNEDMPDWIAASEASHIIQCSTESIRVWARQGKLKSIRTPLGMLFDRADVIAFAGEGQWKKGNPA